MSKSRKREAEIRKITDSVFNRDVSNRIEVLRNIISEGHDVNSIGPYGSSLLLSACGMDDFEIVKELVSLGSDINQRIDRISPISGKVIEKNITALMYVESVKVAKFLVENGADPSLKDSAGKTALEYTIDLNPDNVELAKYLKSLDTHD